MKGKGILILMIAGFMLLVGTAGIYGARRPGITEIEKSAKEAEAQVPNEVIENQQKILEELKVLKGNQVKIMKDLKFLRVRER